MRPDWQRLERLLREPPIPQLAALSQDGHRLALVGGAIRDTLMGRTPRDIDLIVEGDLNAVIDALEQARGRRPTSIGDGFQNTHRFRWRGTSVDIAESIGTLSEDLSRRDFTINAMAVRLPAGGEAQEALVDPHHGLAHLEAKRIVPVSESTIAADPLRVMRGVRYAGQLRGFDLDPAARSVLRAHSPGLGGVAAERVVTEWLAILDSDDWAATLELAWEVGAGQVVFGERRADAATRAWAGIDIATAESAGTDPDRDAPTGRRAGRLAALLFDLTAGGNADDLALTLTDRRWPKSLARTAARAAVWADQRPADERTLARLALLDPAAAEIAGRLAALLGAGATSRLIAMAVVARETRWVTGADLHRLGVEDGPGMGDLLAAAAEGQVRGRWDDAEAARAWVAEQSRARS